MTQGDLIQVLQAAGASRSAGSGSVWDLIEPGLLSRSGHGRSQRARLAVVGFMRGRCCPLFLYTGDPDDAVAWPDVESDPSGFLLVRDDAPTPRFLSASRIVAGSWTLVCTHRPPPMGTLRDFVRSDASTVADFVATHSIEAMVDSFHDDVHWRLALGASRERE